MFLRGHHRLLAALCLMAALCWVPAKAVTVSAASAQPTLIGNTVAGKTYRVTASGVADIGVNVVGSDGQGLPFTPDGKPTRPLPAPYAAFFPNGLDYDPASGPTAYGAGGPHKLYGSLLGTFSASPQSHYDYFMLGNQYVFTANLSGALYAMVNDCCYPDNAGGYEVSMVEIEAATVSAAATQPVFIGNVVTGKTYRVTASGVADLAVGWNNGQGLPFTSNGRPTSPFPAPYTAFFPNGLDYDPASSTTAYGIGGPQKLYGSLLGTFSASPQSHSDYFMMGNYHVFRASSSGALYARVNDCCFSDNAGGYQVAMMEVEAVTVSASVTQPVFIGNVIAGKTYRVTASGVADIGVNVVGTGGQGLPFTPDGKPTRPLPAPYVAFFPNGLDYDPASGPTAYGTGGSQKLYGSLLGSFTGLPQGHADLFMIGNDDIFTAASTGALYAMINDCCYSDNAGGYDVSMSEWQSSGESEAIQYSYDAKGRLVKVERNGGINDGVVSEYRYDAADNRQNVKVIGSSNSPPPQ